MRELPLVIEAILNKIPDSCENKKELALNLHNISQSWYLSPYEYKNSLFAQTSAYLEKYLGKINCSWKEIVRDLYLGKEDYTKHLNTPS